MPKKKGSDTKLVQQNHIGDETTEMSLTWVKASYQFHTFAYRDPRCAFPTAMGLPIPSPTAVLLGIASTLFCLGKDQDGAHFLHAVHQCKVVLDPPDGMIFFRAFHQLRRYETGQMKTKKVKFNPNPRLGFTQINQGTREYGIPEGPITIFVGVPCTLADTVKLALLNRDHIGTHDSLCSLLGDVDLCDEPKGILFWPVETTPFEMPAPDKKVTAVTLSRFKRAPIRPTVGQYWWLAGGDDTELVSYIIPGTFSGTSRGKIYRKS